MPSQQQWKKLLPSQRRPKPPLPFSAECCIFRRCLWPRTTRSVISRGHDTSRSPSRQQLSDLLTIFHLLLCLVLNHAACIPSRSRYPWCHSDRRTDLPACLAQLVLARCRRCTPAEACFLLRHALLAGSSATGVVDDDEVPGAGFVVTSSSDGSDFPAHGTGADGRFSSFGKKRT